MDKPLTWDLSPFCSHNAIFCTNSIWATPSVEKYVKETPALINQIISQRENHKSEFQLPQNDINYANQRNLP